MFHHCQPGPHLRVAMLGTIACLLSACVAGPVPDGGDLIDRMRVDGGGLMLETEFGATPLSTPARQRLGVGVIRQEDYRNRFTTHGGGSGLDKRLPPMRKTPIGIVIDDGRDD